MVQYGMKPTKVEISHKTIIFSVVFLAGLYLVWRLKSILILLFICFVLMEALNPMVKRLEKLRVPRALAIVMIYFVILFVFFFAIAGVVPALISQTTALVNNLPEMLNSFQLFGTSAFDLSSQLKLIEGLPENIAKTVFLVLSNLVSALVVLFITFYMLLERKHLPKYGFNFFGVKGKKKLIEIIEKLEDRLGSWVNAELFLMTTIGILSYIGYLFLGLNYAVPLGILAGVLEIVPNIGPTISTLVAALIGLTISPLTALLAVVWGILVQQAENNFIVPKIMKETVGLNPLVTIILLATGAQLGGILGAVLAVPTYLTFETLVLALWVKKEKV